MKRLNFYPNADGDYCNNVEATQLQGHTAANQHSAVTGPAPELQARLWVLLDMLQERILQEPIPQVCRQVLCQHNNNLVQLFPWSLVVLRRDGEVCHLMICCNLMVQMLLGHHPYKTLFHVLLFCPGLFLGSLLIFATDDSFICFVAFSVCFTTRFYSLGILRSANPRPS